MKRGSNQVSERYLNENVSPISPVTVTTDEDEDSGQESRLTGLPTVIMSIKDKGEDGDCNNGTNSS